MPRSFSLQTIEQQAREELDEELRQEKVEAAKVRLRAHLARPWYVRLFPYRITITRI